MNIQKYAGVAAGLLLGLAGYSPVFAADPYSTAPHQDASPAPKMSSHKKPVRKASKPKAEPPAPTGPARAQDTSTPETVVPGVSGSYKLGNDAGKSNMGTSDHVPGTTGTSGQ